MARSNLDFVRVALGAIEDPCERYSRRIWSLAMLDKIFGKKGQAETPKQSQSMSGIGGSGQQIQAGRDAIATQQAQQATQQQGLTG